MIICLHILLGSIHCRCKLGIAEHIQYPVIADPVSAAKILMGIIIGHAPAKTACHILPAVIAVYDFCMPPHMLRAVFFRINTLCREHVTVVLGNDIAFLTVGRHFFSRSCSCIGAVMYKIIVGINILQKGALFDTAHTACRSGIIQCMGCRVGKLIHRIIILRFVDPHTPHKNRRMIAVLCHHILSILYSLRFPGFIADVLPARNLCKH